MKTADKPRVLPEPSISGPRIVRVGSASYGVPERAGVVSVGGGALVYVLCMARVHAFIEQGELEIPAELRRSIASRYFGRATK